MNQKDHYKSEMNKVGLHQLGYSLYAKNAVGQLYQEAVKVYRLKIYDRVLTVLYAPDIIQLIEYNWSDCEGNYDLVRTALSSILGATLLILALVQAVQTHLLLLTFLFTGARPGSILRTRKYMDCYLEWQVRHLRSLPYTQADTARQDVQLLRVETDNVTTGFNVLLTLKHFKGYHNKARLT